jgi:SecD/SecF fusion protein
LASPNINPDANKGIINIELAGVNDKERVRSYLQSTANLQFFEVYNLSEVAEGIKNADKTVQDYLNGIKTSIDTTKAGDSSKTAKVDTSKNKINEAPIRKLVQFNQPYQSKTGKTIFPSSVNCSF